jgi:PKD repeat protein
MPEFIAILKKRRKKRPTPSFTYEVSGLQVTFTDTSTKSPTRWLWDFGDGNTSTAQNPTHTYAEAGTYSVSLLAINAFGSKAPARQSVEVADAGNAFIAAVEALNPVFLYPLTESASPVANTGSAGGTGTVGEGGGSVTFQAGSLHDPAAGVLMSGGAILNVVNANTLGTSPTVMMLVKTNATLEASDCYRGGGGNLQLRYLADGRVRIYDDVDTTGVSSAAGVVKADEWNLIFWQPSRDTGVSAYATSETAGGTVTQVITSGFSALAEVTPTFTARPSGSMSDGNAATLGAFAIFDAPLTLTEMQSIATSLVWS